MSVWVSANLSLNVSETKRLMDHVQWDPDPIWKCLRCVDWWHHGDAVKTWAPSDNNCRIAQRSQWRAYRKLPSLFLMVPSLTPYDLSFPPKRGFHMPPTYANGHISATGDPIHFMFGSRVGFSGTADRTALFTVRTNPRWRPPPSWIISNGHSSRSTYIARIARSSLL